MRKLFGELLVSSMEQNDKIRLLAGDVGYGILNPAFDKFPSRCFNMGAAEQAMIGAAVGMTYEGLIPICYTITPFLLYRPFEWLRNYVQEEGAPIKLVGSGNDGDYGKAGYTHWSYDQQDFLRQSLPFIRTFFPESPVELESIWEKFLTEKAAYLNLRRG